MKTFILSSLLVVSLLTYADDWNSAPNNWDNMQNNWDNSSTNWKNSPNNWDNSPNKYGNTRIIRDSNGDPQGYAVPKEDGGVNYYDTYGNRRGYTPPTK
jgi:hypothetical protein